MAQRTNWFIKMAIKTFTYQGFEELFVEAANLNEAAAKIEAVGAVTELRHQPIFTAEEMEMAKTLAKVDGIKEGYEQAKKDFEEEKLKSADTDKARTLELIEKINFEISVLNFRGQTAKQKFMEKIGQLALGIAKKVCGSISDQVIEKEISAIINESVGKLDTIKGVKIYLNQQNALNLNDKFTQGTVNVDENMQLGEFRIEWQNGFAERDVKKLWKTIEEICGRHSSLEENETKQEIKQETNNN